MKGKELSAKQQQILNYIIQQQAVRGYPPSVREICEAANLSSTSTVHGHLERLEKKGFIRRDPTKPRAIEILYKPEEEYLAEDMPEPDFVDAPPVEVAQVPIIGKVTAGEPILAQENIEDHFAIPLQIIESDPDKYFMLRVRGESMINAGILDGDLILVHQQNNARNGEIVVALIDDSATVKRFYREKDFIRLQPENEFMNPIYVKDASILGKVRGVFRTIA
ncbi:MAG: transcriptional repressor LexA [Firmicutes bacterium]|nr:transcriptional repressor LexA [Bacillota bacterium]